MARTKKHESLNIRLFTPENTHDLEEIGEILQMSECSILVNLSKSKCPKDLINKAMEFLKGYNTSYMHISVRKVFTRVFVVNSCKSMFL